MLAWKKSREAPESDDARCSMKTRMTHWQRALPTWMALFVGGGLQATAWAQTVPTDLLDLSIEELFDANVVSEADRTATQNRWHLSYTYAISDYDEYYIGTHSVSYDEVLFVPGVDTRTENNYPVVPTEINQEVHAIRVAYDLTQAMTLRAQLPFVK